MPSLQLQSSYLKDHCVKQQGIWRSKAKKETVHRIARCHWLGRQSGWVRHVHPLVGRAKAQSFLHFPLQSQRPDQQRPHFSLLQVSCGALLLFSNASIALSRPAHCRWTPGGTSCTVQRRSLPYPHLPPTSPPASTASSAPLERRRLASRHS